MNAIEAGKICRDAGFNWGRGSYWILEAGEEWEGEDGYYQEDVFVDSDRRIPDLTKGATRGVILEWAREKVNDPYLQPEIFYHGFDRQEYLVEWDVRKMGGEYLGIDSKSEIECYAKLCQWVEEHKNGF